MKVFLRQYREPRLVGQTERIRSYAMLPGLKACKRHVLTASADTEFLRENPDLTYGVVMPWISGKTWLENVLGGEVLMPDRSLGLAKSLAGVLVGMEERGLAHCDLSGPNVILPPDGGAELVDLEEMYGPDLVRPKSLPGGSPGYAHRTAPEGLWRDEADRFSGAVLLGEMLGWCDEKFVAARWGEGYFDPREMGENSERFRLMKDVLRDHWGPRIVELVDAVWFSDTLSSCPTFSEWLVGLPDNVPEVQLTDAASIHTQNAAVKGDDPGVLALDAEALVQAGRSEEALTLLERAEILADGAFRIRLRNRREQLQAEFGKSEHLSPGVEHSIGADEDISPEDAEVWVCPVCGENIKKTVRVCPYCEQGQQSEGQPWKVQDVDPAFEKVSYQMIRSAASEKGSNQETGAPENMLRRIRNSGLPGWIWLLLVISVAGIGWAGIGYLSSRPHHQIEPTEEAVPAFVGDTEDEPEDLQNSNIVQVPEVDPDGQIVYLWHVWGRGSVGEKFLALIDEFNATNEWGITVETVDQGSYSDLGNVMNAGAMSGDLPNIVPGYPATLERYHELGLLVDMNDWISDPTYGLSDAEMSDFYAAARNSGLNGDRIRVGFPHSQSAYVLYYNKGWATELGYESAPVTWDELEQQSCAAAESNLSDGDPDNDGTGGLVLKPNGYTVASFILASGGDIFNEALDAYDFGEDAAVHTAEFWWDLWNEGCAFSTASYPDPEFASRQALFTMGTTVGYVYQEAAFQEYGTAQEEWGFIPFPAREGSEGVSISTTANFAIVDTGPEQNLASWLFIKWFTSPEINAKWNEATGYFPVRVSASDFLEEYMVEHPRWAEGIDLLSQTVPEPARSSWDAVYYYLGDTYTAILQAERGDIPALLQGLNMEVAEALETR